MTKFATSTLTCASACALLLATALLQTGCAAPAMGGRDAGPKGTVEVTSATLGNVTITPSACVTGEYHLFLGADFVDSTSGNTFRVVLQPTGEAILRVFSTAKPLQRGIVFSQSACSKFQLSFERTGWRINDFYDIQMSLDVDCRTASGEALQGMLTVAHCH